MSETDDGTLSARDGTATESDLQAEIERLRAEVSDLHRRPPELHRRHVGWRGPVATLLIVLGCILAPLSVLAAWTAGQISDTGRYVANVTPLIHNPAVHGALTDKITNEITTHIDVTKYTDQAAASLAGKGLPGVATLLKSVAPSLGSALAGFIHTQVQKIVASPAVAQAWVKANTVAHAQLVNVLSGRGASAIRIKNGQVTVSLEPFIMVVKDDLTARGLTIVNKLPPINPTFTLFSATYLVKAQTGYRLINDLKIVLPILALVLLAAGVYLARSHRRALIAAGLGVAASMLVLAAGLLIVRGIYLNSVPNSKLPADAAAAIFDTLVRFMRETLRSLVLVGLLMAVGAFFTGPSVTAVRARSAVSASLRWVRGRGEHLGVRSGALGQWTYAHRTGLRIGVTALAALVFVFWGQPTAEVAVLIVVVLLIVLCLIELIGRPPARSPTARPRAGG